MADWFKLQENWFVEPRLQWAIREQQSVVTVWLWCLTECCRIGSDTIGLHQEDFEMIGIQQLLNLSPGVFTSGINLLEKIRYIQVDRTKNSLKVVKWTQFQSEYLSRKDRGDYDDKPKKRTKNPKVSDIIGEPPPEESRVEENRIDKKTAVLEVVEGWNSTVFPKCLQVTDKRIVGIKARLAEPFFVENWRACLDIIKVSDFCNGKNNSGWKADIDWFIRPDTAVKIMEGKYGSVKTARKDACI